LWQLLVPEEVPDTENGLGEVMEVLQAEIAPLKAWIQLAVRHAAISNFQTSKLGCNHPP
jgi:hypothetical protein